MRRRVLPSAVRLTVAVLVALGLSSCGSSDSHHTTSHNTSVPSVLNVCATVDQPWRTLPGSPVPAAVLGSGPTVVFANMSGNSPCDWLDFAKYLSSLGFRTVVFAYQDPSADGEKQAVTDTLKVARVAASGSPYALVGASLGGRVVIEAASQHPQGLAAIVSLSGEKSVEDYGNILDAASAVTTPALYIGSRHDDLTDGTSQQDALHAAMHGHPNLLVQVPGSDHGIALLTGASQAEVTVRLRNFVRHELSGRS